MSRSRYRNNQPQQRRNSAIEQVFVTKKTIPIKTQPVATDVVEVTADSASLNNIVDTMIEQTLPDVQLVAPVNVDDRPLREFLLAADIHAQQTFLAQVAMIAAKDAKEHMQKVQNQSLKLAQINLANALQQYQQLEAKYQASQQVSTKLKRRRA